MNAIARRIAKLYEAGLDPADIHEQTGFSLETIRYNIGKYLDSDDEIEGFDFGDELS